MNEAMTEALMMSDPNDVFLHPPFDTRLKRVEDFENQNILGIRKVI